MSQKTLVLCLIYRCLKGDMQVCRSLVKMQPSEVEARRLRATSSALVKLLPSVSVNRPIRYSELAKEANKLDPQANLPEKGASLAENFR